MLKCKVTTLPKLYRVVYFAEAYANHDRPDSNHGDSAVDTVSIKLFIVVTRMRRPVAIGALFQEKLVSARISRLNKQTSSVVEQVGGRVGI